MNNTPVSIFFFPHQDDEFGVYQQIGFELAQGREVICAYLTSGVSPGGDPARRNRESLAVLEHLGVKAKNIFFAGALLDISDLHLLEKINTAASWIQQWLTSYTSIAAIYVPAWEGGHPDHDALHAIVVQLCSEQGMEQRVQQFSLYNAYHCPWKFFRVLSPLSENGKIQRKTIPRMKRLTFLRYALSYPSQRMSWVGLFPFFLLHYILKGYQNLQPISPRRICQRPHSGPLYYEKRQFSSWAIVNTQINAWLKDRI